MVDHSKFQRGKGVFKCCTCGRNTRTTHQGDSEACFECWELCGYQNMVWDGYAGEINWEEIDRLVDKAVELGGSREAIIEENADLFAARPQPKKEEDDMTTLNPTGMTTKSLLDLYNEHAFELGEPQVARFADRASAERRTIAMHDRVVKARADEKAQAAAAPRPTPQVEALPGMTPLGIKPVETEGLGHHGPKARDRVSEVASAAVKSAAPRWARPKAEEPGAVAYRPKAGTVQAAMYDLLTREDGVDIEDFCAVMVRSGNKDKSWQHPSGVWSGLRYVFCALRGYGLRFDGARLTLQVPKDERLAKPGA